MKVIIDKVTYNDFRGGKVQKNPPGFESTDFEGSMALNQLIEAKNVALWPDGTISPRSGINKVASHPASRSIVTMCMVPGTDSVAVLDTYNSGGTKYDVKVLHIGAPSTWASPASGVNIGVPDMSPVMVHYGGKVYLAGTLGIREITVTAGAEAVAAVPAVGPATPILLCAHNERLACVDLNLPNAIQLSATGAPLDFTNGIAIVISSAKVIVGIASLENELYMFTDAGIFVLSGWSKNEMEVRKTEAAYSCASYAAKRSFVTGELEGFGPCIFFIDQKFDPMAISRRGLIKVADGKFSKTNFGIGTNFDAAFLPDTKQFIFGCQSWDTIYSVFGNAPYPAPSGTKWGLVDFTFPPGGVDRTFPNAMAYGFLKESFFSHDKPVVVVGFATGEVYLYTQYGAEDLGDGGYSSYSTDDIVSATEYYEPQATITLRLEHAKTGRIKHWGRVLVKASKPKSEVTPPAFSAFYHLGNPISETVTGISLVAATEMSFDIDRDSEYVAVGFNLYRSTAKSTSQIGRLTVLHALILEYALS